jgi:hypothetical protein
MTRILRAWIAVAACVASAGVLALGGCAEPRSSGQPRAAEATQVTAPASPVRAIKVLAVEDDTPPGGDGAPRMTLAFELTDGTRVPIEAEATAYARYRQGVALVDRQRRLVLVTPDGAQRVLARQSGAPPVRGPSGALVYVARYDLVAEVHVLGVDGRDRIVATGLAAAGTLTPQRDGSLVFVGARAGGVAGVWRASQDGRPAQCLTNCELRTGVDWGDGFVPLPRDEAELLRQAEQAPVLATTPPASSGATR